MNKEFEEKIKNEIFNPTTGIIARLNELEKWQKMAKTIIWAAGSVIVALLVTSFYNFFVA